MTQIVRTTRQALNSLKMNRISADFFCRAPAVLYVCFGLDIFDAVLTQQLKSAGWCGNSDAHCGTGCQSGCVKPTAPSDPKAPRADGRCGSDFFGATCDADGPFGGCCSSSMYVNGFSTLLTSARGVSERSRC